MREKFCSPKMLNILGISREYPQISPTQMSPRNRIAIPSALFSKSKSTFSLFSGYYVGKLGKMKIVPQNSHRKFSTKWQQFPDFVCNCHDNCSLGTTQILDNLFPNNSTIGKHCKNLAILLAKWEKG